MSKVICMTVGTGRTGDDIAKALLYSISSHGAQKAVFFSSQTTSEKTMPYVRADIEIEYDEHVIENEDDVQFLYSKYIELLSSYAGEDTDLIVDFTSGTKPMSAAMFAAGVAVDASNLSYVTGIRDSTGRVTVSSSVENIKPCQVIAHRELEKARQLFNEMNYTAAYRLSCSCKRDLPAGSPDLKLADAIETLSQSYEKWERFEWKSAVCPLNKAPKLLRRLGRDELGWIARAQAKFCDELADTQNNGFIPQRLIEVYCNADRRLRLHQYDDATARMYRAFEYLAQFRLWNGFRINTDGVEKDKIRKLSARGLICDETLERLSRKAQYHDKGAKLALKEDIELLAELKDPVGKRLVDMYWKSWKPGDKFKKHNAGELQSLLGQRNSSWLAHGTTPVEPKIANKLHEMFRQLLEVVYPDREELENLIAQTRFIRL
jgi:CRISPR-associated protein (TIGR02710 family)